MRLSCMAHPHQEPPCLIIMPRSKPKEVVEHRVTLGDFERKQLKEQQVARIVKDVGVGVGVASLGVGGTYVAYKIGKAIYDWGEDLVDTIGGVLATPESMAENLRTGGASNIESSGLLYFLTGGLFGERAGQ